MRKKKNAHADVAASAQAGTQDIMTASQEHGHCITDGSSIQGIISNFLLRGERNAISAAQLCEYIGYPNTRLLRLAVERERAAGELILSSEKGYFLPSEDVAAARRELRDFVRRTDARAKSNRLSVRAAKKALLSYEDREIEGQEALF